MQTPPFESVCVSQQQHLGSQKEGETTSNPQLLASVTARCHERKHKHSRALWRAHHTGLGVCSNNSTDAVRPGFPARRYEKASSSKLPLGACAASWPRSFPAAQVSSDLDAPANLADPFQVL